MLEFELKSLGNRVTDYSSRRLVRVKRMGLSRIKKSLLEQHYFYLVGLFKYTNSGARDSYAKAIHFFLTSLQISSQQINALSKKTLMKLHHIL